MMSTSCVDSFLENSVVLEEVISEATGAKDLTENSDGYNSSGSDNLDDSLTSLQWLQEFSILTCGRQNMTYKEQKSHFFEHQQATEAPASPLAGDLATIDMALTPGKPIEAALCRIPTLSTLPNLTAHGHCPDEVDYKTNPHIKPPYSYATLICMAMKASMKSKITLSCIYKWITDNFSYFRYADPTWQNSIRHNLSLNKCFIKVPRQKDEPGKGGFWKIDPQYAERLLSGAFKQRRMPPVHINPALQHQLIMSSQYAETVPTTTSGVLNIGPESQQFLKEFEVITGIDQKWDPHLAEASRFDWRDMGNRHKRRKSGVHCNEGSKDLHLSSFPLQATDEPKVLCSLKSNFDWDALLDSALNGELSLNESDPLSLIPQNQDLTVYDIPVSSPQAPDNTAVNNMAIESQMNRNIDFDEGTFFTEFLHSSWAEEERINTEFLCNSTGSTDQLFDLGDSLRE